MNDQTKERIKQLGADIRTKVEQIRWLRANAALLEKLPPVSLSGGLVDFDRLPHKEVIRVIRTLGGKWKKSVNVHADPGKTKIDYVAEINGKTFRCWGGDPPPSCRLVEVEEDVPELVIKAHKKKVMKLICTGEHEPAAVAIARANVPLPPAPVSVSEPTPTPPDTSKDDVPF